MCGKPGRRTCFSSHTEAVPASNGRRTLATLVISTPGPPLPSCYDLASRLAWHLTKLTWGC